MSLGRLRIFRGWRGSGTLKFEYARGNLLSPTSEVEGGGWVCSRLPLVASERGGGESRLISFNKCQSLCCCRWRVLAYLLYLYSFKARGLCIRSEVRRVDLFFLTHACLAYQIGCYLLDGPLENSQAQHDTKPYVAQCYRIVPLR